ncbi:hypothetical protein BN946_scf184850.g8 [Trametes cinnabarina]|uniref:BTB domain-containing protein n=1 Tax=Pycnoporus cinnabarinus TaxID=5643 RepID=A0A060SJK5_PYCCI|nr:hypothetical protein BN946_scf184850.g8 [Trametes cinnabarina]
MSSTTAPLPAYRDPSEGDVVIRTSDQVDFHVDQRRLVDVSTVFADILSIPQPPSTGSASVKKPVIDVSESSALWYKLLPLIYNDSEPLLNSNSATWLSTQSISPPHSLSSCRCNSASLFYNLTVGQQFPIRRSWLDYLQKMKDIVAINPCGDNACSAFLLEPVIKDAEACTSCANRIGMEAFIFCMNVKAKIEEAISEVPFVFEP